MDQQIIQQPLLQESVKSEAGEGESQRWSSYQYLGSTNAAIPTASMAGAKLSVEEIRSAASYPDSHYPPSLHAPLISSPDSYSYSDGMLILIIFSIASISNICL